VGNILSESPIDKVPPGTSLEGQQKDVAPQPQPEDHKGQRYSGTTSNLLLIKHIVV
jgi:hypothetical protein